jgi:hypothetical protein
VNSVQRVLEDEVTWINPNSSDEKFYIELHCVLKGDDLIERKPIND